MIGRKTTCTRDQIRKFADEDLPEYSGCEQDRGFRIAGWITLFIVAVFCFTEVMVRFN